MKDKSIKVLAISGSLRAESTNTALLRACAALAPGGMELELYEGLDTLPHFNPVLDGESPPAPVTGWRARLRAADAVLICTPEYAGGVPGTLKNALDWTVSSADFHRKPAAVISASPSMMGGDKAHASLLLTITMLDAIVPEGASLMVPMATRKVTAAGEVSDAATAEQLRSLLVALAQTVEAAAWS